MNVLRNISKHMSKVRAMVGKEGFDGTQLITVIPFLMYFRMACNNVDVHEGATVWLFPYFLRSTANGSYHARLSNPEDVRKHRRTKDTKITLYPEAIIYLLSTYATKSAIKEADYAVRYLRQNHHGVQRVRQRAGQACAEVWRHLRRK